MPLVYSIRKYSFCKDSGQWEQFPSRNDLVLMVNNIQITGNSMDYIFKIFWKSTLLVWRDLYLLYSYCYYTNHAPQEELDVKKIHKFDENLSIYSKNPSIGFKYQIINELHQIITKRFQISFINPMEYQKFIYLLQQNKFNIKDDSTTSSSTQFIPMSQINQPMDFMNQFQSQPTTQHLNTSILSQPILPMIQQTQPEQQQQQQTQKNNISTDFLSKILKPTKEKTELNDSELKNLLIEKLNDLNFIKFVEKIEKNLHSLNESNESKQYEKYWMIWMEEFFWLIAND